MTRFTAIFYDTVPPTVGPVRSARLIDLELPAMYDAMLAFSGASVGVNQRLNASDFSDRLLRATEPGFYRTGDTTKPFEHTLYIRMADLWTAVEAKGLNTAPHFGTYNAFSEVAPPAAPRPARSISAIRPRRSSGSGTRPSASTVAGWTSRSTWTPIPRSR